MKKQLLLLAMILLPMVASADAVEIDGIYYKLISKIKEAEVTSNPNKYSGEVNIPETVTYNDVEYKITSIGDVAFNECSDLTSVIIPSSVVSIGNYAFQCCYGLTSVSIPNGVTKICDRAFNGCTNLVSINIPSSVISIGSGAFYLCNSLTSVNISDLKAWCAIDFSPYGSSNPLEWAHHLYMNGEEIKDLVVPYGTLASRTFCGCTGLTSVTIGSNVKTIGNSAFYGCSNLSSIILADGVNTIESSAFEGCTGITSITIPNSVTTIGSSAFSNCDNLIYIIIGKGVNSIGGQAFASCPEVTDVYCSAEEVPTTNSEAFKDSYIEHATLHVPEASLNLYKEAEPWKNFKEVTSPDTPKCATPTISFIDGEIVFDCKTRDVVYVYEIKSLRTGMGNNVRIGYTNEYSVSVYATKAGYIDSEIVTQEIDVHGLKGDINEDGNVTAQDASLILQYIAKKISW